MPLFPIWVITICIWVTVSINESSSSLSFLDLGLSTSWDRGRMLSCLNWAIAPWQWDILTCPLQSSRGLFSNPWRPSTTNRSFSSSHTPSHLHHLLKTSVHHSTSTSWYNQGSYQCQTSRNVPWLIRYYLPDSPISHSKLPSQCKSSAQYINAAIYHTELVHSSQCLGSFPNFSISLPRQIHPISSPPFHIHTLLPPRTSTNLNKNTDRSNIYVWYMRFCPT